MKRRLRIAAAVLFAIAVFLGAWAFWWEPRSLRVHRVAVRVPDWEGRPLRVALVADLHVGSPYITLDRLRDITDRVDRENVDLVFLLGDYVTNGVAGGRFVPPEPIARDLARLHARYGVYAVLGNHDRWFDGERVARALDAAGIEVLENRAVKTSAGTKGAWVVGFSDIWTAHPDVAAALRWVTDDAPVLGITHNPDLFPGIPSRVAITFAGHTHGGQVRLPLVGSLIVPSRFGQRYAAGLVVEGGRRIYISPGIGTSILPVRFRVPPEITIVTLMPEAPAAVGGSGAR